MGATQGAVDALRAQAGLPTDVKAAPGSSPAAIADANLLREPVRPTPAQQAAAVQARQAAAPEPPPTTVDPQAQNAEILAAKDKAILDLQARVTQFEANSTAQAAQIQALTQPAPVVPPEPQLPADFASLTPHDQTKAVIRLEADRTVRERMREEREATSKQFAAVAKELKQATEVTSQLRTAEEERVLLGRYPQLDLQKHKEAIDRKRADLPGMSLLDAVRTVVDPSELTAPAPQVPFSQAALASRDLSMDGSRQAPHTGVPKGPSREELLQTVGTLRRQGRGIEAEGYIDALIKRSVPAPKE